MQPLGEEVEAARRIDLGRQCPGRYAAGGGDGDREPCRARSDEGAGHQERDRDECRHDEGALDVGRVPGEVPVREAAQRQAGSLEVRVLVEPQLRADDEEERHQEAGYERRRACQGPRKHSSRRGQHDRNEIDHVPFDDQVCEPRREESGLDRGVHREGDACRDPDGHERDALPRRPDPPGGERGDRRDHRQHREPNGHRSECPHAEVDGAVLLEPRRHVPGIRAMAHRGADGDDHADGEEGCAHPVPGAPARAPAREALALPQEHEEAGAEDGQQDGELAANERRDQAKAPARASRPREGRAMAAAIAQSAVVENG